MPHTNRTLHSQVQQVLQRSSVMGWVALLSQATAGHWHIRGLTPSLCITLSPNPFQPTETARETAYRLCQQWRTEGLIGEQVIQCMSRSTIQEVLQTQMPAW